MTYFGFLLWFVIIPILLLLAILRLIMRESYSTADFVEKNFWRIVLAHIFLAVIYTTPWDNYLVATGVWSYHPQLVSGVILGWVPLEEYLFFVLETILCGLWWLTLAKRLPATREFKPAGPTFRLIAAGILVGVWIFFCALLFSGWKPTTYLSITLAWALPAILPQFLFGADILWHHRRLVIPAILVPGLYLSLADIVALKAGTWNISPAQTVGVLFFGILPVEEVIFFFITTILIVFGLTLMLSIHSQGRFAAWQARKYKGLP